MGRRYRAGRRFRFHCTDGHDAVFDLAGRSVAQQRELRGHAEAAARVLMGGCGPGIAWSDWIVDVYDAAGRRRMTLAFGEVPPKHR